MRRIVAAVLLGSGIGARAQTTAVYFPAELQDRAGNTYVWLESGQACQLVIEDILPGTYVGLSFRRPAMSGPVHGLCTELRIDVTPGLQLDARAVDARIPPQSGGRVTLLDGVVCFPDVAEMPVPGLALILPYGPSPWAVPFSEPVQLHGDCWWTVTLGGANTAWKVDAHDHRMPGSPGPDLTHGPTVMSAGSICGSIAVYLEPGFVNDYWNSQLGFRAAVRSGSGKPVSSAWLAVLMIGSPLPAPLYLDGCAIRIDPSLGCAVPMSRESGVDALMAELRAPWSSALDRSLFWSQIVVLPESSPLSTSPLWASTPAPWTPYGFGVNSSFVDSVTEPGHQVFPVTVLWRSTP